MRIVVMIAAGFLLASCVSVGRIQDTQPVRTTKFAGSAKSVARCVHQRLGGKVQNEGFDERYVIYDSVKTEHDQGLTHYAITIASAGPNEGIAEWRIMRPQGASGGGRRAERNVDPGKRRSDRTRLSESTVQRYWGPVLDCAEQAKGTSS